MVSLENWVCLCVRGKATPKESLFLVTARVFFFFWGGRGSTDLYF